MSLLSIMLHNFPRVRVYYQYIMTMLMRSTAGILFHVMRTSYIDCIYLQQRRSDRGRDGANSTSRELLISVHYADAAAVTVSETTQLQIRGQLAI